MQNGLKLNLTEHMKEFGLHLIGEGIKNSVITPIFQPYLHAISLCNVAHGTEIILKARIAEEYPLLIFDKIPKMEAVNSEKLEFLDLLEKGNTISFFELPDRLWASTGFRINNLNKYRDFGRLRNQIIHFAALNLENLAEITLRFTFEVIEPAINHFWNESVITYTYDDQESELYVLRELERLGINIKKF